MNVERRPTIVDVARTAGVSKSTVSLVLRDSPLVAAKTRDRVRQAMHEIGYIYNRTAANLRAAGAGLIGLVINDLRNPFFTEFAISLQMALATRNFATVIANTDENPDLQARTIATMIEHGVTALIVSPAYGDASATFDAIGRAEIPAMQVLRSVDARTDRFPFAGPDYGAGGRRATAHLLASEATHIAFVGGFECRTVTEERMAGYLAELERVGMQPLALLGRASRQFGRETAHRLARDYPDVDAVLCFNDLVALGLLAGCAQIGRSVGDDLRIVGFDDIEECADSHPRLSSVRCDIAAFGQCIADTMIDWLATGAIPAAETRTPVELIVRESSGTAT